MSEKDAQYISFPRKYLKGQFTQKYVYMTFFFQTTTISVI